MEDDFLLDAEEDIKIMEFIKAYLPQDVKPHFTDDDILYFMDSLAEYLETSGILDVEPDADGTIELDVPAISRDLVAKASKEGYGTFDAEDVEWVVQGDLEYGDE